MAKPLRILNGTVAASLLALGLAASVSNPAAAQEQPAAAVPDPSKGWIKICDEDQNLKKEVCIMTLQINAQNGNPIASLRLVEVADADTKGFSILVPPGLLLQPGIRVQVDNSKQQAIPYQICLPNACIAEARVDEGFVNSMKRGANMKIVGLNREGKPVEFSATLAGFTAMYDGPGLSPDVAQAATETLQQKLQRRAEEARKRLLEERQTEQESN
ncbi:MAG: invasion associated locus B family protein [Pseudomonadota bacterium]